MSMMLLPSAGGASVVWIMCVLNSTLPMTVTDPDCYSVPPNTKETGGVSIAGNILFFSDIVAV